jgi:hypothetical protein
MTCSFWVHVISTVEFQAGLPPTESSLGTSIVKVEIQGSQEDAEWLDIHPAHVVHTSQA